MNSYIFEEIIGNIISFLMMGAMLLVIITFTNKKLLKSITEPFQRIGVITVDIGISLFFISLYVDISEKGRHPYDFFYFMTNSSGGYWVSLSLLLVGIWFSIIHKYTTAKLWQWIKTGKFK